MSAESAVVKYGFQDQKNFLTAKQATINMWQRVSFVEKKVTERLGTTSSFTRHLKLVHPAKYKKYFESSRSVGNENQRITLWLWLLLCPEEYQSYLYDFVKKETSSELGCAKRIRILLKKKHEILRIQNKKTAKAVWRLNFAIVAIKILFITNKSNRNFQINKHRLNLEKW